MNDFQRFIETSRDCDAALLDIAVSKGISRANEDKLDYKKFINLAAAFAVAAALFLIFNLEPMGAALNGFALNSSLAAEIESETLHKHLTDMANAIITFLGGI